MERTEMRRLVEAFERRLDDTSLTFHRSLFGEIDWEDRLVCIKGAKGTGKTTMMLQFLKGNPEILEKSIYVSLDNLWFKTHDPVEVAEYLDTHGGERLFLDEVHHYPEWQTLIKNLYDDFPKLRIVYSGSSMLRLDREGGDLSRRHRVYELRGLSFREFLSFDGIGEFPKIDLMNLLKDHRKIARGIVGKIKVLPAFERYVRSGYYPFYKVARGGYQDRIHQIVRQILENDYPKVEDVSPSTIAKTERMLMILASSCPQLPKMKELYAQLETDRNQGLKMMYTLERAGLLSLLSAKPSNFGNLSRPDKIYCNNTNLMYALSDAVNTGTLRESFFLNQLRGGGHSVSYPGAGDFLVDKKYLFEVGGKGKGFDQIKDVPNSFVVNDDVEIGFGNKIPLWLFGFLY